MATTKYIYVPFPRNQRCRRRVASSREASYLGVGEGRSRPWKIAGSSLYALEHCSWSACCSAWRIRRQGTGACTFPWAGLHCCTIVECQSESVSTEENVRKLFQMRFPFIILMARITYICQLSMTQFLGQPVIKRRMRSKGRPLAVPEQNGRGFDICLRSSSHFTGSQ